MACGKAVVGSDISGVNSVITNKKTGLLVPSMNADALADAIMFLLQNKEERDLLGKNARALVLSKYNLEAATQKVQKLYDDAIRMSKHDEKSLDAM
jgi:glycosyltransferase involved in cell wall biosynthesis